LGVGSGFSLLAGLTAGNYDATKRAWNAATKFEAILRRIL
jgi:hypothetical protein